jgi:hypothetical protein
MILNEAAGQGSFARDRVFVTNYIVQLLIKSTHRSFHGICRVAVLRRVIGSYARTWYCYAIAA